MKNIKYLLLRVAICTALIFGCKQPKEKKASLSESELLLLMESCYMQGYLISRMGLNADSAWTEITKPFHNVFK